MINRISTYIRSRAIKIKRFRRPPAEPVLPLSEVQVIVAMVLAGNMESFMDEYDKICPKEKRTQQLGSPPSAPGSLPKYQAPPPPPVKEKQADEVVLDFSTTENS